jgi:hypothetical protein
VGTSSQQQGEAPSLGYRTSTEVHAKRGEARRTKAEALGKGHSVDSTYLDLQGIETQLSIGVMLSEIINGSPIPFASPKVIKSLII